MLKLLKYYALTYQINKAISLLHYIGVNDTGIKLIDTTENLSQDSTTRHVVDYSSLFLLFTTDNVESNDGDGFEMYILESQDYCK